MRTLIEGRHFLRDLKRIKNSGIPIVGELKSVVALLRDDIPLPEKHHDHALKGNWVPSRECHIRPDVLLVYEKRPGELELLRLGSHSELFGR